MRTSVKVLVGATFALIVAVATIAIARSRAKRDDLHTPVVAEPTSAAMRAAATDKERQERNQVDTRAETVAQSAERLAAEDRMIDQVAGALNNDNTGTNTRAPAGNQGTGGIALPANGVAVTSRGAPQQQAQSPQQLQQQQPQWQTPYAEDYEAGYGIGGYAGYGLPLNVSDFLVNNPGVVNNGQSAQLDVPPDSVPRPAQAQPQVRATPPGGAALSPPAPGANTTVDNLQDNVAPPAAPPTQQVNPQQNQPVNPQTQPQAVPPPPAQAPPGNTVR